MLLGDAEWGKWSNREIARRAGVAEGTVRNIRPQEAEDDTAQVTQYEPRTTTFIHPKTGQPTEMRTGNIGHSRPTPPPYIPPPPPPASTTVYGTAGAPKSTTTRDTEGKPLAVAWPTLEFQGWTPQPCPLKPADLLGFPG